MRQPDDADLHRAARLFRTLGHPDRVLLACRLLSRRATQTELLAELPFPQSTLARHIGALRDSGLIKARRNGSHIDLELDDTVSALLDAVCRWVHPVTGEQFEAPLAAAPRAVPRPRRRVKVHP